MDASATPEIAHVPTAILSASTDDTSKLTTEFQRVNTELFIKVMTMIQDVRLLGVSTHSSNFLRRT